MINSGQASSKCIRKIIDRTRRDIKSRFEITAAMARTGYSESCIGNWGPDASAGSKFAGPLYTSFAAMEDECNHQLGR
jgi:hypothetical protein